ncbi:energy transducer TonB [bacterium]|nr:energy transducer TonB [bacterium]MCB2202335.1 energy transducer TonB [bacterium]
MTIRNSLLLLAALLIVLELVACCPEWRSVEGKEVAASVVEPTRSWKRRNPFLYPYKRLDQAPREQRFARFVQLSLLPDSALTSEFIVELDDSGEVYVFNRTKPSGYAPVDRALSHVLSQCKFEPARIEGRSVYAPVKIVLTLTPADSGMLIAPDFTPLLVGVDSSAKDATQPEEADTSRVWPTMVAQIAPEMPFDFYADGEQATCKVECLVEPESETPLVVCLWKSSGWLSCDRAALEAAMKCRFSPGSINGVDVGCWVAFSYTFVVEDK